MKYLNYAKRYKIIILFILIIMIILSSLYIFYRKDNNESYELLENNNEKNNNEENNPEEKNVLTEIIEDNKSVIKVDIKGAVNNPGVYELEENSRVNDAIAISGGLSANADTSIINLSKVLTDQMVIIIYTKKEVQEMKKATTTVSVEKECVCPILENDACIENTNNDTKTDTNTKNNELSTTSKISLNTSTLEELTSLSGIGESKAKAIIEYREKNSGFKSIEEIKNVSGIGESVYEKIKDNITI
jgi:competence protein ComEA